MEVGRNIPSFRLLFKLIIQETLYPLHHSFLTQLRIRKTLLHGHMKGLHIYCLKLMIQLMIQLNLQAHNLPKYNLQIININYHRENVCIHGD